MPLATMEVDVDEFEDCFDDVNLVHFIDEIFGDNKDHFLWQ